MSLILWRQSNSRNLHITGTIGKFQFFSISWDILTTSESKYKLTCSLPGIVDVIGNFKNEELAKIRAEEVLNIWLNETGLISKD